MYPATASADLTPLHPRALGRGLFAALALASVAFPGVSHADATVGTGTQASCTEAALTTALGVGGNVSFNCGAAPATIVFTDAKTIAKPATLLGNDLIILSGNKRTRLFNVNAGVAFKLVAIILEQANSGDSDGGAIANHGALTLERATVRACATSVANSGAAIFTDGPLTATDSTFDGNTAGNGGAIFASQATAVVQITGGQLSNNLAQNTSDGYGGAIWVGSDARLNVNGAQMFSNSAHYGGAIFLSPNANATLRGVFSYPYPSPLALNLNSASQDGGAIFNYDGVLSVDGGDFSSNTSSATGGFGGAISSQGALALSACMFYGNKARYGGAVHVGGSNIGHGSATIDRTLFRRNESGYIGGGLYANDQNSTVDVTRSAFSGNVSGMGGGLARFNADLRIEDSSFTENFATQGGGIYIWRGTNTTVATYTRIQNTTVSTNTATGGDGSGGGIFNLGTTLGSGLELYSMTIVTNLGGGVATTVGNVRFRNTVLWNAGFRNCTSDGSQISDDSHNLASDFSCGLAGQAKGFDPKIGAMTKDPGGVTVYHLPLSGSPLINVGGSGCPTLDQIGKARIGVCDIGAKEANAPRPTDGIFNPSIPVGVFTMSP